MPKLVVDLKSFDQNVENVVNFLEALKKILEAEKYVITTHDIDREIQNIKTFKNDLLTLVNNYNTEKFKEQEECVDILDEDFDPEKKRFLTDKYGNVFYKKPFEYNYVELSYGDYSKFLEVRFLGDVLLVPVRYYIADLEHRISPTVLRLFENIDDFTKTEDLAREALEYLANLKKKLDEACEGSQKAEKPKTLDWRQLSEKYFYPAPIFQKSDTPLDQIRYNELLRTSIISNAAEERTRILNEKLKIFEKQKTESIETKENPKSDNPAAGTNADANLQEEECPAKEEKDFDDRLEEQKEKLAKELEKAQQRLADWFRKHSIECVLRDTADCLIPPNANLCDILFKDPNPTLFYTKLSVLKAPGLSRIYDEIIKKLDDVFGVTEIRDKSKEIKELEKLIKEEERLLSFFNEKSKNLDKEIEAELEKLADIEQEILSLRRRINTTREENIKKQLRRRLVSEQSKKTAIEVKLQKLRVEGENLPASIRTLTSNLNKNKEKRDQLKEQYGQKIAEFNFNEKQAQLISQGKNLEAVLLVPSDNEALSAEAVFTKIVSAVDSIMPFENLCMLIFQASLRGPNFQLPEDFFDSLLDRLKDPFAGLYVDFNAIIIQFVVDAILNALDTLLAALCNLLDEAVSNTFSGIAAPQNSNPPDWQAFIEKAKNQATMIGQQLVDQADLTKIVTVGVSNNDTKISFGVQNAGIQGPDSFRLPIAPTIDLDSNSDVINFFAETGQASPLSQWDISPDGKKFVYSPTQPLFNFEQLGQFFQTAFGDAIGLNIREGRWSSKALIESMTDNKVNESNLETETPPTTESALTANEVTDEIKTLIKHTTSILSPSETINLMTGKPSTETRKVVIKLAEIYAPNTLRRFPGEEFIPNVFAQMGIAAGSLKFERQIKDLQAAQEALPATNEVVCERYDNVKDFRLALMSETISPDLAEEILNKIEEKRVEDFNYIVSSFSSVSKGEAPAKPQSAVQLHLDIVSQMVEAEKNGKQIETLNELEIKETPKTSTSLQQAIQKKEKEFNDLNPAMNAMFELTAESIIRPVRDRFNKETDSYVNIISRQEQYIKKVSSQKNVQGTSVMDLSFLGLIGSDIVPAIRVKQGTVIIRDANIVDELKQKQAELEDKLNRFERFWKFEDLGEGVFGEYPSANDFIAEIRRLELDLLFYVRLENDEFRGDVDINKMAGTPNKRLLDQLQIANINVECRERELFEQFLTGLAATATAAASLVITPLLIPILLELLDADAGNVQKEGELISVRPYGIQESYCYWSPFSQEKIFVEDGELQRNTYGEDLSFLLNYPNDGNSWIAEELWKRRAVAIRQEKNETSVRQAFEEEGIIPLVKPRRLWESDRQFRDEVKRKIENIWNKIDSVRNKFRGSIEEELQEVKNELRRTKSNFEPSENAEFEVLMLPTWVFPFEKDLGGTSVKTTRLDIDILNPLEPSQRPALELQEGDYVTNGYVQESYINSFYKEEENTEGTTAYVTASRNVVGDKYLKSLESLPSNLNSTFSDSSFTITLNHKADASKTDPYLIAAGLLQDETGKKGIVDASFVKRINDVRNTDFSQITRSVQTLTGPNKQNIDYDIVANSIQKQLRDYVCELKDPTRLRNLVQSSRNLRNPIRSLQSATPVWKISFTEQENEESIITRFVLQSSGFSFTPNGKYHDFYHDTDLVLENQPLNESVQQLVYSKYGENRSRRRSFETLFDSKTRRDLELKASKHTDTGIQQTWDILEVFPKLLQKTFNKVTNSYKNNRLLSNFSTTQGEDQPIKLIELAQFSREPSENEKNNSVDPNIMDFQQIKEMFKELYNSSENEDLTLSQARGEVASQTKSSKAASNVLLLSFIRLCVTEHVMKSIFIYDQLQYSKDCSTFYFIIKDISKFILQEAKRNGVLEQLHRQADAYYDVLVEQQKIQNVNEIEQRFSSWIVLNSYNDIEPNPKLEEIVKLEFPKIINKFSKVMNCSQESPESDSLCKLMLEGDDIGVFDVSEYGEYPDFGIDFLGIQSYFEESEYYIEKYVKLGKINKYNVLAQSRLTKFVLVDQEQGIRKEFTFDEISEAVLSLSELKNFIVSLGENADKLFDCDDPSSSWFDAPPKFGARIVLNAKITEDSGETKYKFQGINIDKEKVKKTRSYVKHSLNYNDSYSDVVSNTRYESVIIAEEEVEFSKYLLENPARIRDDYDNSYYPLLFKKLTNNRDAQIFFKYCLVASEFTQMLLLNTNLIHHDREGRFLFEGTKAMIGRLFRDMQNVGNLNSINNTLQRMLQEQKEREDNTGNPLGPAFEALKFYIRTPIQMLRGLATLVDPNLAIADKVVAGAAMAGNLIGEKIDIPYSLASLALMPFPLFNGVVTPPPLTTYNLAMPVGPAFLALEWALKDLPYYQNDNKNAKQNENGEENPFACELLPEENDEE